MGSAVIINVDSMQLYRDIPVLSASPDEYMKHSVPHFLYNFLPAESDYNVATYIDDVKMVLEKQVDKSMVPILVGGTGMYINALLNGIAAVPQVDEELRVHLREKQAIDGNEELYRELAMLDSEMAHKLNRSDSQRILRALEVVKSTGKSLLYWQTLPIEKPFSWLRFEVKCLIPPRDLLYRNCNQRLVDLLNHGGIDEVSRVLERGVSPRARITSALGFAEVARFLRKEIDYDNMVELAQTRTRQYAKRQCTWFRSLSQL